MGGNRFRLLSIALGLSLAGCTAATSGHAPIDEVTLQSSTWDYYQQYLRDIGPTGRGAFAVSRDGGSAFYFYCPGVGCIGSADYRYQAIKGCEQDGKECAIFAFGSDIVIKYKVSK